MCIHCIVVLGTGVGGLAAWCSGSSRDTGLAGGSGRMLRGRWWTPVSRGELEDGPQDIVDAVLGRELFAVREWDPCSCAVARSVSV